MADGNLIAILASLLEGMPGVSVGRHLNNTNFLVGNKVFAFMQGGGVALKLPKATIQKLVEDAYASPLVMGKRVMKEWVVIEHEEPAAYRNDEALFRESVDFVSSKA